MAHTESWQKVGFLFNTGLGAVEEQEHKPKLFSLKDLKNAMCKVGLDQLCDYLNKKVSEKLTTKGFVCPLFKSPL